MPEAMSPHQSLVRKAWSAVGGAGLPPHTAPRTPPWAGRALRAPAEASPAPRPQPCLLGPHPAGQEPSVQGGQAQGLTPEVGTPWGRRREWVGAFQDRSTPFQCPPLRMAGSWGAGGRQLRSGGSRPGRLLPASLPPPLCRSPVPRRGRRKPWCRPRWPGAGRWSGSSSGCGGPAGRRRGPRCCCSTRRRGLAGGPAAGPVPTPPSTARARPGLRHVAADPPGQALPSPVRAVGASGTLSVSRPCHRAPHVQSRGWGCVVTTARPPVPPGRSPQATLGPCRGVGLTPGPAYPGPAARRWSGTCCGPPWPPCPGATPP